MQNYKYIKIVLIGFIISLLFPLISHAQISISEIMYDPAGSDSKREWIEVFNEGTSDIDLTKWFFLENNVFHKIVAHTDSILKAGQYAVIADSVADFLNDYSGFAGLVFDSAFTLNNTGEPLSIADPNKEIIDAFTYTSEMGANSDGNSLQLNNGVAITAQPTPGALNKTNAETPPDTGSSSGTSTSSGSSSSSNSSSNSSNSTHTQQSSLTSYVAPIPFKIGAGRIRNVSIHTPVTFEPEVQEDISNIKYEWNFGDMNTARGKKTTHIYEYAGTYNIVLEAKSKGKVVVTRTKVHVVEPDLDIIQSEESISITNLSSKEFNIGDFVLQYMSHSVHIPTNTILEPNQTLTIARKPHEVLRALLYFDGNSYLQMGYTPMALSAHMWCSQNTHLSECNQGYMTKLFDIIKGWVL